MKPFNRRRYETSIGMALPPPTSLPIGQQAAAAAPPTRRSARWTLEATVEQLGPFEPDNLLLGVAEDGLPVIYDLNNPNGFTLLLTGAHQPGLQAFLFHTARALAFLHPPGRIRFGLLSPVLSVWQPLTRLPHAEAILTAFDRTADDYIGYLTTWAWHIHRHRPDQYRVLLIDRLDVLAKHLGEEAFYNLEWLLQHGPQHGLWPLVAVDEDRLAALPPHWQADSWLRIHGFSRNSSIPMLADLSPQGEFALQTPEGWLRFSPAI